MEASRQFGSYCGTRWRGVFTHSRELRRTVRLTGGLRLTAASIPLAGLPAAASVAPNSGASIVNAMLVHVSEVLLEGAMDRFTPDSLGLLAMRYQMVLAAAAPAQVSDTRRTLHRGQLFRRMLLD